MISFIYSLHRLSDIVSILQREISWSLILKFFLPRVLQNQMIRDTYTPESTEALKRIKYVTLLIRVNPTRRTTTCNIVENQL